MVCFNFPKLHVTDIIVQSGLGIIKRRLILITHTLYIGGPHNILG